MAAKAIMSGRSAAKHLSMTDSTFKRLVEAGEIPCWQDPLTGRRRYSRIALDEWQRTELVARRATVRQKGDAA